MKINIIIDNKNNWFYSKVHDYIRKIEALGHRCTLLNSSKKIPKGSDVTFFLGCEQYVSKETRAKSHYNIVIHASNLPKGRGMSPASWQILENKRKIPVTLFEVAEGLDTGDFYLKDHFVLNGTELLSEWQDKLYECIERMTHAFLRGLPRLKPKKQRGTPSVYKRRRPSDSELNIHKSIDEQFNLLRIVDNEKYPAFFIKHGVKYVIKIFKEHQNSAK